MTPTEFEALVLELLRLSGLRVTSESLHRHKRVDVFAEEFRRNKLHRIAIECKMLDHLLTQAELTKIAVNYQPLLDSNECQEVLVVTKLGLTPSAKAMVEASHTLSHLTLSELEAGVIDFSTYLNHIEEQIAEDGLSSYYVNSKCGDGKDLEEFVTAWIRKGNRPLAVIGGYGIGKTSFARHFAARLARDARADPSNRIPIILRLTDISAEQSLEGLLGRTLTTKHLVKNYAFESFMTLNSRGRFVVFLDGFDEMKHTLTWDQFCFNMSELNRLVAGDSRVILLGRPTAFLSDDEQLHVLHGVRKLGGERFRDPSWPDYYEVVVQPFDRKQVNLFLDRYAAFLTTREEADSEKRVKYNAKEIARRIKKLPAEKLADLATRPVQLRILAEVLPQWDGDEKRLTTARMYSAFIDLVIEREQKKITRRYFDAAERREFARNVAYWLWTSGIGMNVDAADIPDEFFPAREDVPRDGIRRDMVSACFLERKAGDKLYFPHRSFQEYLVAEGVLGRVRRYAGSIQELSPVVTTDVASFLADMTTRADAEIVAALLREFRGKVPLSLLTPWLVDGKFVKDIMERVASGQPYSWDLILYAAAAISNQAGLGPEMMIDDLVRILPVMQKSERDVLFACLIWLVATVNRPVAVRLLWHALEQSHATRAAEFTGFFGESILTRVHLVLPRSGAGDSPRLDVGVAFEHVVSSLATVSALEEWVPKHVTRLYTVPRDLVPVDAEGFSGNLQEYFYWEHFRGKGSRSGAKNA